MLGGVSALFVHFRISLAVGTVSVRPVHFYMQARRVMMLFVYYEVLESFVALWFIISIARAVVGTSAVASRTVQCQFHVQPVPAPTVC